MKDKLVLHTCCAICMCYPKTMLDEYETIFYFYNPNIHPIEEYNRRRDEFVNYANSIGIEEHNIIVDEDHKYVEKWYEDIKGFEDEPEKGNRCNICFKNRMEKSFAYAKDVGAKYVTTVMTVSPHKNSKTIEMVGNALAKKYSPVEYLHFDFKKQDGFKKTNIIANEANLYRQHYCGCEFSIRK